MARAVIYLRIKAGKRLEVNKEESDEDYEEMFDQVYGCLQEREAATFGASSSPETAAPETADWPAPGPCQPMPCFYSSGGVTAAVLDQHYTTGQCYTTDQGCAQEGDAGADAAMCTCC